MVLEFFWLVKRSLKVRTREAGGSVTTSLDDAVHASWAPWIEQKNRKVLKIRAF